MAQKTTDSQNTAGQQKANSANILAELIQNAQIAYNLLLDSRVSLISKLMIPGLALIYFLSPIDLLPDVIPVLGQLDDIAVILLITRLFIELAPTEIVAQYRASMGGGGQAGPRPGAGSRSQQSKSSEGDFVDADFRVVNDA